MEYLLILKELLRSFHFQLRFLIVIRIFSKFLLNHTLWLLLVLPLFTQAQTTQTLKPSTKSVYLTNQSLYYLEDKESNLSFEQVRTKTFKPLNKKSNSFGLSTSTYWVKFTLKDISSGQNKWLFELGHPLLDYIDFYIPTNNNWKKMKLGDMLPFHQRPIKSRLFVVPLLFANDSPQTYYLRVKSTSTIQFPITIYEADTFYVKQGYELFISGLFYGVIFVMALYNLFIYFSLRSPSYLFYSLALFFGLLFNGGIKGDTFQFLWSYWPTFSSVTIVIFGSLFMMFLAVYTNSFLITRTYAPFLRKILWGIIILSLLSAIVNLFDSGLGTVMLIGIFMVNMPLMIITGIICYRKGLSPARFFVMAWIVLAVGGFFTAIAYAGFLPFNFLTKTVRDIGGAMAVVLLSLALSERYKQIKKEKEETQKKMLAVQQEANEQLEQKVQERTKELQIKNNEVLTQNEELHQQQEEIIAQNEFIADTNLRLKRESSKTKASIQAASAIQNAILPSPERLKDLLGHDYFVFYQPKDIVSGDFYWISKVKPKFKIEDLWQTNQPKTEEEAILQLTTKTLNAKETTFIAVVDCTGHGVPGAFMSMIGNSLLNEIINESLILETDKILTRLHEKLNKELRQNNKENTSHGMDVCLCRLERSQNGSTRVYFTGAKRPLYYVNQEGMQELRGDRLSIGGFHNHNNFTVQTVELQSGDVLYMTTDGMVDSPNLRRKSFGTSRLKQLMTKHAALPLDQQKLKFVQALDKYRQGTEQRDDITILGFRIP
ncbi:hypothetical protein BKI52_44775 [marine bacterium AO1-C]|nr:hypothetical protein BKI52_44775 [marine bacterium AO1-C]